MPLDPQSVPIIDRPIDYGSKRKELTLEYRRRHQNPSETNHRIEPKMVVLHYTGGGSARATWRYFNRATAERGRRRLAKAGRLGVSAHFIVDRDGTVWRLMPETFMGRHVIGLNHVAVGVENVGDGKRYPLTQAQVDANVRLIRYLASRYDIRYVIGHSEYRQFENHALFKERERHYRNQKGDPGADFLAKVRIGIADLGLAGPPATTR